MNTWTCKKPWELPAWVKKDWGIEDVQLESDLDKVSDPICSSSGWCGPGSEKKKKDDYPKDYPVPDLGMDHDIITTHKNLDNAIE